METYQYFCSDCNYFVETSGPWPFYKQEKEKVRYKNFLDASSGPIHGLRAQVYCPACDKKKEYDIVEYEKPLSSLDEIWLDSFSKKTKMICHKCKKPVYLVLPSGVKCPRCKKGEFETFTPFLGAEKTRSPVPPPVSPLRVRQGGSAVRIPKPTVVIDSQEHKGYTFERFTNWFSGTIRKRLATGDYTLQGMEEEVAIERKTLPDLVNSIIQDRKDFIEKCERLSTFRKKCLVVEGSLSTIKTPYEDSQAHPNAVLGSLLAAQERWEIPVYFLDDIILAEEFVASMLSKYHAYRWLEENGYERCLIEGDI
jgi:DNA excision repair protein ERCC-4